MMPVSWKDLEEGSTTEPMTIGPISRTDIVRYQGASGDMNPIHHDEPFATDAGYPAPLVVGMLPVGAMNTWATNWLGPENVRLSRARWKQQVWPGETLTCSGKVVQKYEDLGERKVDLEITSTKEDGSVAAQVWMTFVVP
jgi:acyl dehydratase